MVDVKLLSGMIDTRIPIIVIETFEERKALDLLALVAAKQAQNLYRWSSTDGVQKIHYGPQLMVIKPDKTEPDAVLQMIKQSAEASIFALCDFHSYFSEPVLVRLVKDIVLNHFSIPHTLVFISHKLELPAELSRFSTLHQLALPDSDAIIKIIEDEAKAWTFRHGGTKVKTDNITLRNIVNNLQGLSVADIRRLVRGAIWDDGALTHTDIKQLNKAKFALLDMEGIVSFESEVESIQNLGGLPNLKRWLQVRRQAFNQNDKAEVIDRPKGILLLGVQGGGKSLAAKAVASIWGIPLMRLDIGALYNKYHGETERNLREALQLADAMSPCVLWIDEIEKAMSQDNNDGGTSQRLLGALLTWMAERKSKVFIVATSNDVSRLPPELIRKGRLDEIFFVDLPELEDRKAIFNIHLLKRGYSFIDDEITLLAAATEGFSGAEIEQLIVAALFDVGIKMEPLNMREIELQIHQTSPLSVVMHEQILRLRAWASERTIRA